MTQDKIIEMARQAGFERLGHTDGDWVCYPEDIERFANLVATKEREACAKLAENRSLVGASKKESAAYFYAATQIAAGIRARGQA